MGKLKSRELDRQDSEHRIAQPPATLEGIAEKGIGILCWCNRCGHNAVVPTDFLLPRLPAACPVPEIGTFMRCRECGSKDVATRPDWPSLGQVARHNC